MEGPHEIWLRSAPWGLKEMFEIDEIWGTLSTHKSPCIPLVDFMCQLSDNWLQIVSRKSTVKVCSHTNAYGSKYYLAVKKVKVNRGSSFKQLKYLMLHTKFQGHRPFGSREEDILPYMDLDHLNKRSFPHPMEAPYEIWFQSTPWFQRRRCLKMLAYIRTTEA